MKDLYTYINEAKRLSDLKGKRVGKIEVGGEGNIHRFPGTNSDVRINNIERLSMEDIEEMYDIYDKTGGVDVVFDYEKSEYNIDFYRVAVNRCTYNIYKDGDWIHKASIDNTLEDFIGFWEFLIDSRLGMSLKIKR